MNNEIKQLIAAISTKKDGEEKKEIYIKIGEFTEKIEDTEKKEIVKSVLKYFYFNKIWKKEESFSFTEKLLNLNFEHNYSKLLLEYFDEFSGIIKYLLSINDITNNENILCTLKLKLINGDISDLIDYLNRLKPSFIKEKSIQKILMKIDFNNYLQINFIHELLRILFQDSKIENENLLNKIIENINKKEFLRCKYCFDILYCYKESNYFKFLCNNNHLESFPETKEKIDTKIIIIKCDFCGENKQIYEKIVKCLSCKGYFCDSCIDNHKKNCFLCEYINIYQIGFVCEKHNKLYNDCCFICNKNLCDECQSSHYHMCINENKYLLISDKNLNEFAYINEKNNIKDLINYYYSRLFIFTRDNNLFNLKIFNSLNCLNGQDRKLNLNILYSNKFGDENFKNYYKNLLENITEGSINACEDLKKIFEEYRLVKIKKSKKFKYNDLITKSKFIRERKIGRFIKNFKCLILNIGDLYFKLELYLSELNSLKRDIIQNNEINLLKIKNIALYNSNRLSEVYLRNLINRYLADRIIHELINKYPNHFSTIKLNLQNIYEIFKSLGNLRINENMTNRIKEIITNLKNEINEDNINDYFKNIKDDNEILFIKDIKVQDSIIKKEDLNYILELLFLFKKMDNEVEYPNTDNFKTSFIKLIRKDNFDFENIQNFQNIINSSDLEQSKQNKKIKKKLDDIVKIILKDFNEITYIKKININNMLDFIFKNISDNIIKEDSFILRVLKQEIDVIIEEQINIKFDNFIIYDEIIKEFQSQINKLENEINNIKLCIINDDLQEINKKINISMTNLVSFNIYKLEEILSSDDIQFGADISQEDKISSILYVIGVKFLNMKKDFETEISKLRNKMEEIILEETIKEKIKKIYLKLNNIFNNKNFYITMNELTEKINDKIIKSKNSSLFTSKLDIKEIYNILEKIIGTQPLNWLESPISKGMSLDSYLYYMQNIN